MSGINQLLKFGRVSLQLNYGWQLLLLQGLGVFSIFQILKAGLLTGLYNAFCYILNEGGFTSTFGKSVPAGEGVDISKYSLAASVVPKSRLEPVS